MNKPLVLYDMSTDFSSITDFTFIHSENITPLNRHHFLHTGIYMLNHYSYFSIEQWIYNTLYNSQIDQSRCNILYTKLPVLHGCINSFFNLDKVLIRTAPLPVQSPDATFQYIYSSMTQWMRKNFYDFYKLLIQLKIKYSAFFFSEICEFVKCPYTISSNRFFKNWKEFLQFQDTCDVRLIHMYSLKFFTFEEDFLSISAAIGLDNFLVNCPDYYVAHSICTEDQIPNGRLYCINQVNVVHDLPQPSRIRIYIDPKPYVTAYDQYMKEILNIQKPASVYSIMAKKVYDDVLNKKYPHEFLRNLNLQEKNGILLHEGHPIIFYYKAYQITTHKIKFAQQNIYKFFACNLISHKVELILMRKTPPSSYEIIELVY